MDSPIFGPTREPYEHESAELQKLAECVPVAMFQALNRALNARGFCLAIDTKLQRTFHAMDITALPRYQSHKVVRAAKIVAIDFGERLDLAPYGVQEVGAEWIAQKKAEAGGYYVVYEDGYTSYSPARAFEEGNTLLDRLGGYEGQKIGDVQPDGPVDGLSG